MIVCRVVLKRILNEKFLIVLVVLGGLFFTFAHLTLTKAVNLVEWHTVGALFGLLILSYGLEQSGYFQWLSQRLVNRFRSERQIAIFFVVVSACLSTVITNDISLFIVIPLALEVARRLQKFPIGRLVIFIAFAVNVGSSLTAVGNPQNLFLWQTSHVTFLHFARVMFPLVGVIFLILLVGAFAAFSRRQVILHNVGQTTGLDRRLLTISLILYPAFLIAIDAGYLLYALFVIVVLYAAMVRKVFRRLDWALLMIFILMFIDFKSLAMVPLVRSWATQTLAWKFGAYKSGLLFSQVISNVPATILLQSFHPKWQRLAWGVDVGGFGFAIGSLANLIALRLARLKNLWIEFHIWSLVMLTISYFVGMVLL